jgi:putative transposase
MDERGLLLKKFPKKDFSRKSQGDSSEELKAPDQKWSLDIKHFRTLNGDRGYAIAVKDCYTKEIVGHVVSRRHTAKEIEEVLYSALANRNFKELPIEELYVVSDNAKEIKSAMEKLRGIGIKHVCITPYSPWENGEIESFFSCLEREVFWRFEMESFEDAKELIEEYVRFYNNERIHGGIGYKTPRERYLEFVSQGSLANVSG